MLKNLNPITIGSLGEIIYQGYEHASDQYLNSDRINDELSIENNTIQFLYQSASSNIVLDIKDGIGLLYLTNNLEHNDITIYLLDKTVIIPRGIFYNFSSLYGSCIITIGYNKNSMIKKHPIHETIGSYGIYPKVDINNVYTLFYQEKELNFMFKGEKHDFWELTYVDKGQLSTLVDGKSYDLEQGQVIFYSPNQHHKQSSYSDTSVCFMTITFDMSFEDSNLFTNKVLNINTEMKGILKKILSEKNQSLYYYDDLILCYLKEFIIKLIRSIKLEHTLNHLDTDTQNNIENSIIQNTINYIQNNINKKITIPDIASSIPISPSYLSKIFKKHMNNTIVDYINNYKLERSKVMIRESDYNITQISNMLGYNSVHYFSKQFKKYYGISPTQYSKSIKQQ